MSWCAQITKVLSVRTRRAAPRMSTSIYVLVVHSRSRRGDRSPLRSSTSPPPKTLPTRRLAVFRRLTSSPRTASHGFLIFPLSCKMSSSAALNVATESCFLSCRDNLSRLPTPSFSSDFLSYIPSASSSLSSSSFLPLHGLCDPSLVPVPVLRSVTVFDPLLRDPVPSSQILDLPSAALRDDLRPLGPLLITTTPTACPPFPPNAELSTPPATATCAVSQTPVLFASSRPSSLARAPVPQDALQDVRLAAAASLPRKTARRPAAQNFLAPSVFRPHVPADRRILLWTAPYSLRAHSALAAHRVPLDSQPKLFETLLGAHVPETLESYGTGLLRFHQFCDRLAIPEPDRMPADRHLLSAFVADAAGSCTGKCIRNWLNGLHLWHTYNDAPWHGDEGWLPPSEEVRGSCRPPLQASSSRPRL
ncbi:hypothetical protein C8R45DRAFT_231702 [Mycena sanguinolenta]|nr:hypothetical protein C8R45DRAFT_231702 [Mycena sanguinolenta]